MRPPYFYINPNFIIHISICEYKQIVQKITHTIEGMEIKKQEGRLSKILVKPIKQNKFQN